MRSLLGLPLVILALVFIPACGSDTATIENETGTGVRLVSPDQGASILSESAGEVTVVDLRTPTEYAEGHLDGAVMIDFYEPDFADRIDDLDRDGSYLIYCRSGSRSDQARRLMAELGFTDVADIEGGVVAWADAGLPLVR